MTENEKALEKRIEILELKVNNTVNDLTSIKKDVEYTAKGVTELKDDFKRYIQAFEDLKQKPAKRWDSLVGYGIAATISAIVTYVATHFVK